MLPIMIGMNPPTKEVILMRTVKPLDGGCACAVYHADFPEGTKMGDPYDLSDQRVKRYGLACWLQFKNAESMRIFGQKLVDFAKEAEEAE